ncbi:MAG: hypothetical protein A2Y12_20335 [Planctomycetes bacterium GWF2_42_9]|nr:MAG: hypothetical protein A2Y12_20335 [Planctomycetes bacterium GWF2_42_9]
MLSKINIKKVAKLYGIVTITMIFIASMAYASEPKNFATSQDAVDAFIKALKEGNNDELLAIFGSEANELIYSGDPVADSRRREMFVNAYNEQNKIEPEGDKFILIVGKNEWPFPIPIIKNDQQWIFDIASGREEIINRRIGWNELSTIEVMLAIVDAQREYAMKNYEGDGVRKYAQKFKSDPGKKNGLYWETIEGQEPSPLGSFIAAARNEGYFEKEPNEPQPYHGYFFRILTAQGENAQYGAYDYIVNGKLIGGFAVVAWPAEYGNSGIMTFIVNHDGVVYQKDLGENTGQQAQTMKLYNPDKTWTKIQ